MCWGGVRGGGTPPRCVCVQAYIALKSPQAVTYSEAWERPPVLAAWPHTKMASCYPFSAQPPRAHGDACAPRPCCMYKIAPPPRMAAFCERSAPPQLPSDRFSFALHLLDPPAAAARAESLVRPTQPSLQVLRASHTLPQQPPNEQSVQRARLATWYRRRRFDLIPTVLGAVDAAATVRAFAIVAKMPAARKHPSRATLAVHGSELT